MKKLVKGKVVIVTGASRGIGKAIALTFAQEGAKVVVNFRKEESKAKEVVEKIEKQEGTAISVQADVGDRGEVESMINASFKEFGVVDILINNAGVFMGGGSILDFNDEEFYPMWRVNVKGILNCTRAIVPHFIDRRYGKIVNIASVAGLGTAILPGNMLYASTKAAVIILTKRLALELGQYGINVNGIAPGLIRTDMALVGSPEEQERHDKYFQEKSILRRIGEPEDIAHTALFLASEKASFITGQVLTVDGGRIDFITHSL